MLCSPRTLGMQSWNQFLRVGLREEEVSLQNHLHPPRSSSSPRHRKAYHRPCCLFQRPHAATAHYCAAARSTKTQSVGLDCSCATSLCGIELTLIHSASSKDVARHFSSTVTPWRPSACISTGLAAQQEMRLKRASTTDPAS